VQQWRLTSATPSVREWANKPTLFTQNRQPESDYLALPEVSSENRFFIPIKFISHEVIASNKLQLIAKAPIYIFGILSSTMHNAWMRYTCGRLKSDYSYAPSVYNNYPWPKPKAKQRKNIEAAAQGILDARAAHPKAPLGVLYDPVTMPPNLVKAHQKLDKAVDAAYGYKGAATDTARVAFLFELYCNINTGS
jgi:hypothetical protein